MIKISDAIRDFTDYKRFYNFAVDCNEYVSGDEDNRIIIFQQPTYIDYLRSAFIPNLKYLYKRLYYERIFLFIKHSYFINSVDDLYIIDKNNPELFQAIEDIANIISAPFKEIEIKIINEILDALVNGSDLESVKFDTENEMGVFNWAYPYIFLFWFTQDENGLVRISTEEMTKLKIHEQRLLVITQVRAIKYKNELNERAFARARKK